MSNFQTLLLVLMAFYFTLTGSVPAQNPSLPVIPTNVFRVTEYGAVGDGQKINTAAIQKTIDVASKAGGGIVLIPEGRFLTGPFLLTSRINLHLDKGAMILISDDMAKYPVVKSRYQDCISVTDGQDIEISGEGTIDGQGKAWWAAFEADHNMTHRPYMIKLYNCKRVRVQGVTLSNSPMFHLVPQNCTDVTSRESPSSRQAMPTTQTGLILRDGII